MIPCPTVSVHNALTVTPGLIYPRGLGLTVIPYSCHSVTPQLIHGCISMMTHLQEDSLDRLGLVAQSESPAVALARLTTETVRQGTAEMH